MRLAKFFIPMMGMFGAAVVVAPASAATVTQCGPNICYQYEDAQSGIASFGNPSLTGDALVFLVPNFRAESLDGAGLDQAIDSFVLDSVYAMNGDSIAYVGIVEFGDYEITNGDRVSAQLDLLIEDNDSTDSDMVSALFTSSGDSGGLQTWQIDAYHNPAMHFSTAEDLKVTITDILEADTDAAGEAAWIQKKITLAATTVVPLPAAAWLFISALGVAGLRRRR